MKTENQKPLQKQLYIVTVACWKCEESIKVALINDDPNVNNGRIYGPELFSEEEIKLAQSHDVIIEMPHSATRQDDYRSNICKHCGTFMGQHYLHEYFLDAQYGDYRYQAIDIASS